MRSLSLVAVLLCSCGPSQGWVVPVGWAGGKSDVLCDGPIQVKKGNAATFGEDGWLRAERPGRVTFRCRDGKEDREKVLSVVAVEALFIEGRTAIEVGERKAYSLRAAAKGHERLRLDGGATRISWSVTDGQLEVGPCSHLAGCSNDNRIKFRAQRVGVHVIHVRFGGHSTSLEVTVVPRTEMD